MTVAELKKKLDGVDPKIDVACYREDEEGTHVFEITDVSVRTGSSIRNAQTGKVNLKFSDAGSGRWLLIEFEDA